MLKMFQNSQFREIMNFKILLGNFFTWLKLLHKKANAEDCRISIVLILRFGVRNTQVLGVAYAWCYEQV